MLESLTQLGEHIRSAEQLIEQVGADVRRLELKGKAANAKCVPGSLADNEDLNVLGLGASASESEIRTAFRRMASVWHPDRPNGNEAVFSRINSAVSSLLNR